MMFGVPATRDLTVMVIEAPVVAISVPLVFPVVLAFLSKDSTRTEGYAQTENRRAANYPPSCCHACCHDFLQYLKREISKIALGYGGSKFAEATREADRCVIREKVDPVPTSSRRNRLTFDLRG
jgi:hypothetical protein